MGTYAFISYCHEDIRVVRKFHRRLESVPVHRLIRKRVKDCPRKLYPLFRDETDLSGVTLTPEIEKALDDTECLIVVCTRNSAVSPWVEKEIAYFLRHHSPLQIIPVFLDRKMMKSCAKGYPGVLAALDAAKENQVLYRWGKKKQACFEITARVLQCYSPALVGRYDARSGFIGMLLAIWWIFVCLFLFIDLSWVYKEYNLETSYCRDIDFSYGWPEPVDPLNAASRLSEDTYYICTKHKNRIIRIERVTNEPDGTALPGSFLLESDIMEFAYNNYWQSDARISRIVFRDKDGQVIYVKNYSLGMEIVDLAKNTDTAEPFYLPDDTTCRFLAKAENTQEQEFSCRIAQRYDANGRITQIWFLSDTDSYLACDENGYFGITYTYLDSGELCEVAYIDLEGNVLQSYSLQEP